MRGRLPLFSLNRAATASSFLAYIGTFVCRQLSRCRADPEVQLTARLDA